jgi:hypothetical protein
MMLMPWGRVGSNLLFAILRQSAPMKLANESLNKLRTKEEQNTWFEGFYEVGVPLLSFEYIGSKQSILAIRDVESMKKKIEENAVRVIRLRRDNYVKSAVSQIRAAEHFKAASGQAWVLRKGLPQTAPIRIEPDVLLARICSMRDAQENLMKVFLEEAVLDVEYEQINSDLEGVVFSVRKYLGLPNTPYRVPHEKFTPDHLSLAIANYDEIFDRLSDTPYWSMI